MNTIFIGIAGGTGSGKTTLTEHLAARFGSDISVLEGGHNLVALDMIMQRIASHIRES